MSASRLHSVIAPTNNKKNDIIHLLKVNDISSLSIIVPRPRSLFGHMISIAKLFGSGNENVVGLFSSLDPFVYFGHVVSFVIN